jgi:quercetin 2,3-dioxygenase
MADTAFKRVLGKFGAGSQHWVGDGFPVRNVFPSNGTGDMIDPFLMLDYAGPLEFPPTDQPRGVGEHPHRGFETVTIVYQGVLSHRDSTGNAGVIGPGDVQWMTAASGLVHEEKHEREFAKRGGTLEIAQLWVNLPGAHKMSPPGYQEITAAQIPVAPLDNNGASHARVIAGELNGIRGPARTFTAINVFDVRLSASSGEVTLTLPASHVSILVLLRGSASIAAERLEGPAQMALLGLEGSSVAMRAHADSVLLVLSGEPIGEPVASQGPFVMNTQAELRQAIEDYRHGRMGHL